MSVSRRRRKTPRTRGSRRSCSRRWTRARIRRSFRLPRISRSSTCSATWMPVVRSAPRRRAPANQKSPSPVPPPPSTRTPRPKSSASAPATRQSRSPATSETSPSTLRRPRRSTRSESVPRPPMAPVVSTAAASSTMSWSSWKGRSCPARMARKGTVCSPRTRPAGPSKSSRISAAPRSDRGRQVAARSRPTRCRSSSSPSRPKGCSAAIHRSAPPKASSGLLAQASASEARPPSNLPPWRHSTPPPRARRKGSLVAA